jgi:hypothetical protein
VLLRLHLLLLLLELLELPLHRLLRLLGLLLLLLLLLGLLVLPLHACCAGGDGRCGDCSLQRRDLCHQCGEGTISGWEMESFARASSFMSRTRVSVPFPKMCRSEMRGCGASTDDARSSVYSCASWLKLN